MTDTQGLTLTDTEIGGIYEELSTLHVDLDDDPLLYGPKRLNGKIAQTRKMLTRCEQIFLELSRRLHGCQREHRKQTALLEMLKQDLLANDPEVRAGRNIADRDATAAIKLRPQIEDAQKLEEATTDLGTVLVVVKAKRIDIKDMQNRLKDQIKICQEEIGMNGRWGSQTPDKTSPLTPGQLGTTPPKVATSAQMGAMLDEIDAELAMPVPPSLLTEEPDAEEPLSPESGDPLPEAEPENTPPSLTTPQSEMGAMMAEIDNILESEEEAEVAPTTSEIVEEPVAQDSPTVSPMVEVLVATATQTFADDALDALVLEDTQSGAIEGTIDMILDLG